MTNRYIKILPVLLVITLTACSSAPKVDEAARLRRAATANVQLGVAYMNDGNLETAMEKFSKAIEQDPKNATAYASIAVLYGQLNERELAEKNFRKALRLKPDDSRTHNNYGLLLCRQGHYIKAEEQFNAAASDPLYPGIAGTLTNAGVCASRIPDTEKAEEYFRRALDTDPRYIPALLHMISTTYSQGNYMNARGYLQRFEDIAPYSAESLWLGVRIEDALRDYNASARYGLLLSNNFPDTEQTKRLREWENERRHRH